MATRSVVSGFFTALWTSSCPERCHSGISYAWAAPSFQVPIGAELPAYHLLFCHTPQLGTGCLCSCWLPPSNPSHTRWWSAVVSIGQPCPRVQGGSVVGGPRGSKHDAPLQNYRKSSRHLAPFISKFVQFIHKYLTCSTPAAISFLQKHADPLQ